jgi:hypothetical protein
VTNVGIPRSVERLLAMPCKRCGEPIINWTNWFPEMDEDGEGHHMEKHESDLRGVCVNNHQSMVSW